jgi:hypothetical protein
MAAHEVYQSSSSSSTMRPVVVNYTSIPFSKIPGQHEDCLVISQPVMSKAVKRTVKVMLAKISEWERARSADVYPPSAVDPPYH